MADGALWMAAESEMMEEIVKLLWSASENHKECRIVREGEPFPRVIHPYGVCKTSRGKIMVVCRQVAGFTKAGREEGYRNLDLKRIQEVELLETNFEIDPSFNPEDSQYQEWVYHI